MARIWYGGTLADYGIDASGRPQAGAAFDVRTGPTPGGGVVLTDLLDELGAPITQATANARGFIRFQAPDGTVGTLYLLDADDHWFAINPMSLADQVATIAADGVSLDVDGKIAEAVVPTSIARAEDVLPRGALVLNAKFMPGVTSTPAVGDGTTDDTTALRAFVTAVVAGGLSGFIPPGNYKLTDRLDVRKLPGWTIRGAGRGVTTLTQATDNKPHFYLGSDDTSQMHSWEISDMSFTYTNNQPVTNTSAIPILFNGTNNAFAMYQGVLERLTFARGYYGIGVTTGTWCPWGMHYDDLWFQGGTNGLTGGAITMAGGLGGIPNSQYGRLYVTAQNMVGPIFYLRGYNSTIGTIEINAANQGAQIMLFAAGAEFTIGAIKLENGVYTASTSLIELQTNASVKIGQVFVGGDLSMTVNIPSSGALYALRSGTGAYLEVDRVRVQLTALTAGQACIAHPAAGKMLIHNVSKDANWTLVNASATDDADRIQVGDWLNNFLSPNKGDADYPVALGDPNVITFSTALTATRTVTLPSDGNNLHNGLYYQIITAGSASVGNPLLIKAGATTLSTVTVDGVVRFTWRRVAGTNGAAGWIRTSAAAAAGGGSGDDSGLWHPADNSLLTWTFDPTHIQSFTALPTGAVILSRVKLSSAATVSNIIANIITAGSGLTAAAAALFDSTGARVGITADQSSVWNSTGVKTMALTTPYAAAAGTYYVALFVTGTTGPAFSRAGSAGSITVTNLGLAAAPYRYASYGTGLTVMPSSVVYSSAGGNASAYWLGLS